MLKFKDILYSNFRYVYPDLIKKDIIGPNEFTKEKLEIFKTDEYYFFSRFYQGVIMDIPDGVTSDNLQSVKCQLDKLYYTIYGQVDKESKFYDPSNLIVVRHDFDMQIYTNYTTKINFLKLKLRLDFVDRKIFVAKVKYYPHEECN
jgi:hypothetical protein